MSYSSVLQIASKGDLGAGATSGAFAPVALVNGVSTIASNKIYLEEGAWLLSKTISFTTNADGTTEVGVLELTMYNEDGAVQPQTIIWNGTTAGAYASGTYPFIKTDISLCPSNASNEFQAQVTWFGVGSPPSVSVVLRATKII
jgi:hypothetical protein